MQCKELGIICRLDGYMPEEAAYCTSFISDAHQVT